MVTIAFLPFRDLISDRPGAVALVHVVVVLLVAGRWGRAPALVASVAGVLMWSVVFLVPGPTGGRGRLRLDDWMLLTAFIVAIGTAGGFALSAATMRRAVRTAALWTRADRLYTDLQRETEERRRAEQELRAREATLRSLFESAPDCVVVCDREGRIVCVNPQAEKMFGYAGADLLGRTVETLLPERSRALHVDRRTACLTAPDHRPVDATFTARRRDGTEFPVEVMLSSMERAHGPLVIEVVRDVTERRHAEDRIRSSLREKEILLAEVHHRVKNNLQTITSLLSLQSRCLEEQSLREVLEESQDRIRSMALVHEQLYQSSGPARIDAAEYLENLIANLASSYGADSRRIQLRITVRDVTLGMNTAIPCGLLVCEVVSNALKHAFPDGRCGEIRVDLRPAGSDRIRLLVSDNGIGLPAAVDFRTTRSLGLRLINALTAQLDGTITRSGDAGTTFDISLVNQASPTTPCGPPPLTSRSQTESLGDAATDTDVGEPCLSGGADVRGNAEESRAVRRDGEFDRPEDG